MSDRDRPVIVWSDSDDSDDMLVPMPSRKLKRKASAPAVSVDHESSSSIQSWLQRPSSLLLRPASGRASLSVRRAVDEAVDGATDGAGDWSEARLERSFSHGIKSTKSSILAASNVQDPAAENESWEHKYAPTTLPDVAMHKRKKQDISDWLQKHSTETSISKGGLLVLFGPSGTSKSAAVLAAASDLKLNVRRWTDDGSRGGAGSAQHNKRHTSSSYSMGASEYYVAYSSGIAEFTSFLRSVSVVPSLCLSAVPVDRLSLASRSSQPTRVLQQTRPANPRDGGDVLLLEGLPYWSGREQLEQIQAALEDFLHVTRYVRRRGGG